jgi:hypothetical protein
MKNLFLAAALVMALIFAGCKQPTDNNEDNNDNNSDIIGTWKTANGSLTMEIGNGTWTLYGDMSYNGTWTRNENTLTLGFASGTATLSAGKLILIFQSYDTYTLSKEASTETPPTTLKIKNESSVEIAKVIWQSVSFFNNEGYYYDDSIRSGTFVTQSVQAGTGYIFFTKKSNNLACRTQAAVTISAGDSDEFTFTDNTIVVDIGNPTNTQPLGTITK